MNKSLSLLVQPNALLCDEPTSGLDVCNDIRCYDVAEIDSAKGNDLGHCFARP
jgi:ABC-type cobalamin/Fe3+-siderophores transport system ATPase subunit